MYKLILYSLSLRSPKEKNVIITMGHAQDMHSGQQKRQAPLRRNITVNL